MTTTSIGRIQPLAIALRGSSLKTFKLPKPHSWPWRKSPLSPAATKQHSGGCDKGSPKSISRRGRLRSHATNRIQWSGPEILSPRLSDAAQGRSLLREQSYSEVEAALKARLVEFQEQLQVGDAFELFQKWVVAGVPVVCSDEAYQRLKRMVATRTGTNLNEVLMVGSAKLGFSLTSSPRFKLFSDVSDVDISVVSPNLFNSLWDQARRSSTALRNPRDFHENLFLGRIFPKSVAPSNETYLFRELQDLEDELTRESAFGRNEKHILVLKSWDVLEQTQREVIEACRG